MKKLIYLLSILILTACNTYPEEDTIDVEDDFDSISIVKNSFQSESDAEFKNYIYTPKEIIHGNNKEFNYETETTFIGTVLIDSLEYNVFTEFRKIQLANSIRGRSTLFFINNQIEDKLEYDCGMPDTLPLDIYKNHFVFKRDEDSTYVFCKLELVIKDIICFDGIECFNSIISYK